jgi:hypothetical protein
MEFMKQAKPPAKQRARRRQASPDTNQMKTKAEEISRWESEGGAFIPTDDLPAGQQVQAGAGSPEAPCPPSE